MSSDKSAFPGFSNVTGYTSVPNPLLGPLLEEIQDLTELKVALRGIWLLRRKPGWPRMASLDEFLVDAVLARSFADCPGGAAAEIRRGLAAAVKRGIFLSYRPQESSQGQQVSREQFLLNGESDRKALAKLESGGSGLRPNSLGDAMRPAGEPPAERPNIFALYEENVGMISPMLAEELKEAEELYPREWLVEAFRTAVVRNRRNWGYVASILRRWAAEGKAAGGGPDREGREDGEPGRNSAKGDRQKFVEAYQRRRAKAPGRAPQG